MTLIRLIPILLLTACTHVIVETPECPTDPIYEPVKADELSCLSDDTYNRLATRDSLLRAWIADVKIRLGCD